jgi:16S rRNA processing protein RimM
LAPSPGALDPMAQLPSDTLILVGAIAGAFGVRGEVKVRAFTAAPEGVAAYGALLDKNGAVVLTPKSWRPIKDAIAITAPEVQSREAAEALRNTALFVPRGVLPEPEDDEFYHVDLIGCRVEALDGALLGAVIAAPNFGAGDLLEVRTADGKTVYYPFTKAAAPIVNVRAKRIVVDPPPEVIADEGVAE